MSLRRLCKAKLGRHSPNDVPVLKHRQSLGYVEGKDKPYRRPVKVTVEEIGNRRTEGTKEEISRIFHDAACQSDKETERMIKDLGFSLLPPTLIPYRSYSASSAFIEQVLGNAGACSSKFLAISP